MSNRFYNYLSGKIVDYFQGLAYGLNAKFIVLEEDKLYLILPEGMEVEEAINRLEGITCGMKPTSCPDQFSKALKAALNQD